MPAELPVTLRVTIEGEELKPEEVASLTGALVDDLRRTNAVEDAGGFGQEEGIATGIGAAFGLLWAKFGKENLGRVVELLRDRLSNHEIEMEFTQGDRSVKIKARGLKDFQGAAALAQQMLQ